MTDGTPSEPPGFIALRVGMDVRYGAIVMGLGVLLGVVMLLFRVLE